MAELEEEHFKPVELNIDDYMGEVSRWKSDSPYLGLAEVMTPEQDPAYQERLKRSSKANAFGSVLSTLMDTATAAAGGKVEKSEEMPSQLRNLEDFNRERARTLTEGRQLKAMQLQDRMNNVRHQIEESRLKRDATAKGRLAKSEADFKAQEAARADKADFEKQKEMSRRGETVARIYADASRYRSDNTLEAAEVRSSGTGSNKTYGVFDGSVERPYSEAQVIYMYQRLADKISKNPDQFGGRAGSFMIPLKKNYNEADIKEMVQTISDYYTADPELNREFVSIGQSGFTPGRGALSPQQMAAPAAQAQGELADGVAAFRQGNRAALMAWLKTKYPGDPKTQTEVGNQIIQMVQSGN